MLNIQNGERDGLPEVVAVLAGDLEVFVPVVLDEGGVLHRHHVPHLTALPIDK